MLSGQSSRQFVIFLGLPCPAAHRLYFNWWEYRNFYNSHCIVEQDTSQANLLYDEPLLCEQESDGLIAEVETAHSVYRDIHTFSIFSVPFLARRQLIEPCSRSFKGPSSQGAQVGAEGEVLESCLDTVWRFVRPFACVVSSQPWAPRECLPSLSRP